MTEINNKTVAFITLGCKLNFTETSHLAQQLKSKGFIQVKENQQADFFVINTCSVTENANKKCRQTITKITRKNPEAFVAVVGCYSQLSADEVSKIPGVNLVLGTQEKFNLPEHLNNANKMNSPEVFSYGIKKISSFDPSVSGEDRTRAFLKIQDGCDYYCSYCTIPLARGKSRNSSIKDILVKTKQILSSGAKEIILTGINIGHFGKSTNETFYQLLIELSQTDNLKRLRLSSIEPDLLKTEIIQLIAERENIMPHIHIPLQSGCDSILKKMNRRYPRSVFRKKVELIKEIMPHAAIGADVIVGFPGESDEDFEVTYDFIKELEISYLHVFPFSERANTKAAKMPDKIPPEIKEYRSKQLQLLAEEKKKLFISSNINSAQNTLFEAKKERDTISGFTENYIRVETKYSDDFVNKIVPVKLLQQIKNGNVACEILNL